jgi:hypothetical protein
MVAVLRTNTVLGSGLMIDEEMAVCDRFLSLLELCQAEIDFENIRSAYSSPGRTWILESCMSYQR